MNPFSVNYAQLPYSTVVESEASVRVFANKISAESARIGGQGNQDGLTIYSNYSLDLHAMWG
jgi:hypothetical protein